jgi:TetR/AcrR family tetracycline transcriptional repressor
MTALGHTEPLSEAEIVEAVLQLAERVGVERLTMRALADELGVTTMAPYRHVKNKDALIHLVADTVLSRVVVRDDGRPWDVQLWEIARANREEFVKYPGLVDYLTHHELLPAGRRQMEDSIALLRAAGFAPDDARRVYAVIYSYFWGRLVLQSRIPSEPRPPGRKPGGGMRRDLTSESNIEFGYRALVAGLKDLLGEES